MDTKKLIERVVYWLVCGAITIAAMVVADDPKWLWVFLILGIW